MSNYIYFISYKYIVINNDRKWKNYVVTLYNNWCIVISFYVFYIETKTIRC